MTAEQPSALARRIAERLWRERDYTAHDRAFMAIIDRELAKVRKP